MHAQALRACMHKTSSREVERARTGAAARAAAVVVVVVPDKVEPQADGRGEEQHGHKCAKSLCDRDLAAARPPLAALQRRAEARAAQLARVRLHAGCFILELRGACGTGSAPLAAVWLRGLQGHGVVRDAAVRGWRRGVQCKRHVMQRWLGMMS